MALFSRTPTFGTPQKPDLWRRIAYTLVLLMAFRVLTIIPVLNVDEGRLRQLLADNPFLGVVDLFAGGEVLTHFSMAAAGIFPYLLALILAQAATMTVPSLKQLKRQGERGKKRMELIAKLLTIPIAFIFALIISKYLSLQTGLFPGHIHWFTGSSFLASLRVVCLVTLGSLVTTWIADLITENGVGQGESLVLCAGACLTLATLITKSVAGASDLFHGIIRLVFVLAGTVVLIIVSFLLTKAKRPIPIAEAKRQTSPRPGRNPFLNMSELPLPLNFGGILPVSAATGLLALAQLAFALVRSQMGSVPGVSQDTLNVAQSQISSWSWLAFGLLIMLFVYIYNSTMISPQFSDDEKPIAQSLHEKGFRIPGVRPLLKTQEYLDQVITRISLLGALGTALLAAGIPYLVYRFTHQDIVVPVLTVITIVKTFDGLRDEVTAYRSMSAYDSFLRPSKR